MSNRPTPETIAAVDRIRADIRIFQSDEMDELAKLCERIERQRDGLMEVCQRLVELVLAYHNNAKAAIASVKGGEG